MKAMIFAAGIGSRLYPLTSDKPKALVQVAGKTLLERALEKVHQARINEIVINIHHFGEQIIDFLNRNDCFGLNIHLSDERDQLLDTGGAILKASAYLRGNDPFLVYNVDVLSNLDLFQLIDYHREMGGLATLAVRNRPTARYLLFDQQMHLGGWKNNATGEQLIVNPGAGEPFAFSGIQVIDPAIFDLITETGRFSLIQLYLRLAGRHRINGFRDASSLWMDLGKPEQLSEAENYLINR